MSSPPDFGGVRVARSLVFCVMIFISFYLSFALFLLVIVLYVLHRITASDNPVGISNLLL